MISVRQGYLFKHIVSTTFVIVVAHLLLYSNFLNHPITASIIVMNLIFKFSFSPILLMTYVTIRYTHSIFLDIYSANLAVNLTKLYLNVLYVGKYHN